MLPEVLVQSPQVDPAATPVASVPVNTLSVTAFPSSSRKIGFVSGELRVFHSAARFAAISLPSRL